ncbi:MAG: hydrogen gas-evolving membrane-bound hydrogenase subunit E [Candidatus Bipolaricaulaceae bacterium]
MRWLAVGALLIVVGFLMGGAVWMRPFGVPAASEMDDYFIASAQLEAATNNVVTSVVFDYRGFDTLGEATVLFCAVVGVALMLRKVKR